MAAASVMLAVVLCVWLRSCFYWDCAYVAGPDRPGWVSVTISKGVLILSFGTRPLTMYGPHWRHVYYGSDPYEPKYSLWRKTLLPSNRWRFLGLGYNQVGDPEADPPWKSGQLFIPLWMLCLPFAAVVRYSLLTSPRRRRRHRMARGLCGGCGYDLRASPGRCPECGAAAEVRAASSGEAAAA